jgi:quinolinate synthase
MLRHVKADAGTEYIVGTEVGLLHRLRLENPAKRFYPLSSAMVCRTMKLTTLSHVADALEFNQHIIEIPEPVRARAARSLEAMLQLV